MACVPYFMATLPKIGLVKDVSLFDFLKVSSFILRNKLPINENTKDQYELFRLYMRDINSRKLR